jgi:type I restriction enzyme S subunit
MNAEVLLEHFHRLGDAPDAVPRLRRFILELATEGKLTSAKRESHACKPLGKLATFVMGQAPPGADCNDRGEGTLFVKVGEFGSRYPEKRAWTTKPLKFAEEGDVLICVVGATVGKLNLGIHCAIGRSVAAIRPSAQLDVHYLYYSLMPFTLRLREGARGTAQGVISRTDLDAVELWCPPLAEQHRIVAKVDELMALCDRLEAAQQQREQERMRLTAASWQALVTEGSTEAARFALEQLPALTTRPAQVKALRQTILDLAVRGKLVEQDAQDEPAEVLLKRIAKERQVIEGPMALPSTWAWVSIRDILDGDSQNGYSKKPDDAPDGIPILRISAGTVRSDALVAEEEHKLIGGITAKQREQYGLLEGDLLACRFNGNKAAVGRLTLFTNYLGIDPIYPDKLIRLRLDKRLCVPALLRSFGQSTIVRQGVEAFCATTVGNWGISATNLKEVLVPLPPLAEQGRIVAKVVALMGLCDRLEAALVEGEAVGGRLLEAVLHTEAAPRTMPPAPVQRLVPTRQPKQAVYEEAEEELALAAEPGVALRRGPGRPRKVSDAGAGSAEAAILGYLQTHGGWHAKSAVLEATGVDAGEWNAAIKGLMEAGKVERIGEKKGARYRAV